jgi:tRNA G18 (ribose-2'-O)-methylase SpoU
MEGQSTLDDLKEFDRPLAIILGNEGKGVKKSLIDNADLNVSIKMRSNTESLNVSVTSGVILHYLK